MLTYDRVTAARLGLTPSSLDTALYDAFGQAEVSVIYTQLNQYYVVLEVAPQYWQSPDGLNYIYPGGFRQWRHSHQGGLDRQGQHHALAGRTTPACFRR